MTKKVDFILNLEAATVDAHLRSFGRLFQSLGAITAKAQPRFEMSFDGRWAILSGKQVLVIFMLYGYNIYMFKTIQGLKKKQYRLMILRNILVWRLFSAEKTALKRITRKNK